ncbi:MAG: esterase [Bdellovibrionota bacterium]|nr:esterase [Bdellovibrionota bacterium]
MSSLEFTETMRGFASKYSLNTTYPLDQSQFEKHYHEAKELKQDLDFTLTIKIANIDEFCDDPKLQAEAIGSIQSEHFGGKCEVIDGKFNLFVRADSSTNLDTAREMHYRLHFNSSSGEKYTFYGFKTIEREDFTDVWDETTTLYTYIFDGHIEEEDFKSAKIVQIGVLRILVDDFIQQLKSFEAKGGNLIQRAGALAKFLSIFAGNLWEAYAPFIFGTDQERWDDYEIPLQSYEGVRNCSVSKIPINTNDGLHISMDRFVRKESEEIVLLLHGLTTSTDMFIMPEHYNLVSYLMDHDYPEVWSLDWRGSMRHTYNLKPLPYSIDDIAMNDIPAAIEEIKRIKGEHVKINVICHCVGSLSFFCSLAAGKLSNIKSIISNSVSLTPKVRWQSKLKLKFGPTILEHVFGYPYVSPEMPYFPGPAFGKWIWWMERMLRSECKEPACHMISFMWGWGFPAAYEHHNLNPITHRRLKDLFGGVSFHYYRHIYKMLKENKAIPYSRDGIYNQLPESYFDAISSESLPRTLFVSGSDNKIFPQSNKLTYEELQKKYSGLDFSYQEYKAYGHQDTLMGMKCSNEIFPKFVKFLKEGR